MKNQEKSPGACCGSMAEAGEAVSNLAPCCAPSDETSNEGTAPDCCPPKTEEEESPAGDSGRRHLEIDFIYLDLSVCVRCKGTDTSLEEAISDVASVLEETEIEVAVNKIHVQSEEQALDLGFESSPTIPVNGRDIQLDVKESLCESCCEVAGGEVDCRVWTYRGKEYTVPPKAMIMDAILREVYGGVKEGPEERLRSQKLPENLNRFFALKRQKKVGEDHEREAPSCP